MTTPVHCSACGSANEELTNFCKNCGVPIAAAISEGIIRSDHYKRFIGPKNQPAFLSYFKKVDQIIPPPNAWYRAPVSWSWVAFFFPVTWMFYRKMWANAFLYVFITGLVIMLLGALSSATGHEVIFGFLNMGVVLASFFVPPMYAKSLYRNHCRNKIAQVKADPVNQGNTSRLLSEIARKGGTSSIILFIVYPFLVIAGLGVIAAVALPAYQDYITRAKVAEVLIQGLSARSTISEYYAGKGKLPRSLDEAGYRQANSRYVESLKFDPNRGVLRMIPIATLAGGKSIDFIPKVEAGALISWTCSSEDMPQKFLPPSCRK